MKKKFLNCNDFPQWTVVAFLEENKELEYSVVPLQWIYEIQDEQYCFWPPSHQRKHIEKATPYKTDWNPYKIHVFLQHGVTYADAMSYEQKLVAESTNSETEPLKVAGRKRKPTAALADYVLESCSSEDSSYIPPLPKMSHQSNISDDTLSMTSSELMPPPEESCAQISSTTTGARFVYTVSPIKGRNRAFSSSCSLCIKPVSNSGGRAVHQTGKTFSDEWCLLRIKPAHHLHRPDRPRAPTSGACCASNQHTISTAQTDLGLGREITTEDNRLRFIKHNRIIHLQVQEGKLLQRGYVDPKTVQWVPPEDYKITDRYISKGQDYHTFSWEGRIIELTEIKAEEGSVVTGVRFIKKMDSLSLQVVTTAFDFNTGKLEKNPNCSTFKSTPNFYWRHKFKENVKLESPDIPIRKNLASTDFSKNKCIKFTNTDYQKDAGQTTIPFFDAQPVNSTIPTPLSGVGLFHKGHKGSGGFIAPKIFTYDFSKYILVIHAETRPMSNKPITNSQTSHMATNYKEKTNNFSKDNVTKPSDVKASHLSSDTTITKYKNSTQSPRTPSLVNRKTKTAINVTGAINTITVRPDRDNEEDISLTITMIFILVPQLLLFIVAIIIFKKQLKKICVKTDMDRRPETIPLQNIVIESHNLRNIKKENFIEYLICNLETNELEDGFLKLPTVTDKTTWEALRNINNNKNRHCKRNNLPYDYNRVVLKKLDGVGTGDYINASYINGVDRSKAYIASQGPKYYTLRDFWRMIWQEKVEVIVMATNFINDDGNKRLCAEYLPPKVDSIFECGRIIVELIDEENYEYYVKRKLKVRYLKFQREICHIHIHWQSDSQLLYSNDLMPVVKEINQLYEKTLHPVLIHSGYGTTRTGVLILCDMALKMLKSCNTVNIYDLAKKLAEQRCSLINSSQQYILVHLLISEYIMEEDCPLTDSATESLQEKDAKNLLKYIEELCYYDKIVRSWMPKATETNIPTIFADGYGKHENYIVTQLRRNVENKSAAFWMLVADKSVDCIVSLSNVTMQLYPCRRVYENVVINIEFIKVTETPAFVLRTMSLLIYHKITQTIQHKSEILLYEVKDAKQSPTFANNILTLICDVKKHNKIVVSCSDGVTTCGLFLVLAYITDKFKAENKIDIVNAIRVARRTGIEFFNTKKHLQMLNTCISKYLENFGEYTLIDECSPNTK
ncbi:hypothetical protein TcasGA2_TC031894 [Tribolium castaneum]|uniref:Uncharacterized protein n=1 Tax=Tribolium castaneum TaxID=7070 RepID=A0A139WA54_TRICA|nr:hypothetical protein TcasGA2_TC031894 [Tribolium castaneum]